MRPESIMNWKQCLDPMLCHARRGRAHRALRSGLRLTRKRLKAKSTMLSSRHMTSFRLLQRRSVRDGCAVRQLLEIVTSPNRFTLYSNSDNGFLTT
jgi:hypothetical protein